MERSPSDASLSEAVGNSELEDLLRPRRHGGRSWARAPVVCAGGLLAAVAFTLALHKPGSIMSWGLLSRRVSLLAVSDTQDLPFVEKGCHTLSASTCCSYRDGRAAFYGDACLVVTSVTTPSWDVGFPCQPARWVSGGTKWQGTLVGCSQEAAAPAAAAVGAAPLPQPAEPAPAGARREPAEPSPGGQRRGSFIAIGDWGWDPKVHGNLESPVCQQAVARKMRETMETLGDVQFVLNIGDSFYPDGVTSKNDPQWDIKWRNMYHPTTRSVPWYSVYGNHDYHHDPCACADVKEQCSQVNADKENKQLFYMPSYAYFEGVPELGLEIVAMDLNHYQWGWMGKETPPSKRAPGDCQYSPCKETCEAKLKQRAEESFGLFFERARASTAKNLLVFSHYPTDYFETEPDFLSALSNASRRITYFGGHRHNVDQDSTISIAPNTNWLSGGGGGWSCEDYASAQGFVVGEIYGDFSLRTYAVLVEPEVCCPPPPSNVSSE